MEEDLAGHGGVVKKIVREGKGDFPSRGSLVSGLLPSFWPISCLICEASRWQWIMSGASNQQGMFSTRVMGTHSSSLLAKVAVC